MVVVVLVFVVVYGFVVMVVVVVVVVGGCGGGCRCGCGRRCGRRCDGGLLLLLPFRLKTIYFHYILILMSSYISILTMNRGV